METVYQYDKQLAIIHYWFFHFQNI